MREGVVVRPECCEAVFDDVTVVVAAIVIVTATESLHELVIETVLFSFERRLSIWLLELSVLIVVLQSL